MNKGLKWTLIIAGVILSIWLIVYFVNKNKKSDLIQDLDLDSNEKQKPLCPEGQFFDPIAGCIPIKIENERLVIVTPDPTTDPLNTNLEINNPTLNTTAQPKGKLGAKIPKKIK